MKEKDYKKMALDIRERIIDIGHNIKKEIHYGASLSLVEILLALFYRNPIFDDSLILSKGHGALSLYLVMNMCGLITDEQMESFKRNGSSLSALAEKNKELSIEFSGGSLGMGLSYAVGKALAFKKKDSAKKVYVILGDGECNEGSVWEAAWSASFYGLDNIVAIIDDNHMQYDGPTEEIMGGANLEDKFRSFGWEVISVDGQDVLPVMNGLNIENTKPLAILADTKKGAGISFMENNPVWHNRLLTDNEYEKTKAEISEMRKIIGNK